jgi:hypothetical protein
MEPMIEWKLLPHSLRYENDSYSLDIWPYKEPIKTIYKYTIYDKVGKRYLDNGNFSSINEACEYCLKYIKL